jgi:hypothetical protein
MARTGRTANADIATALPGLRTAKRAMGLSQNKVVQMMKQLTFQWPKIAAAL